MFGSLISNMLTIRCENHCAYRLSIVSAASAAVHLISCSVAAISLQAPKTSWRVDLDSLYIVSRAGVNVWTDLKESFFWNVFFFSSSVPAGFNQNLAWPQCCFCKHARTPYRRSPLISVNHGHDQKFDWNLRCGVGEICHERRPFEALSIEAVRKRSCVMHYAYSPYAINVSCLMR